MHGEFPALKCIVAPRHVSRIDEAVVPFQSQAFKKYSELESLDETAKNNTSIVFINQLGILRKIYALAHVAVVGGSWYPGVEGHNPIEPAALGIPTVFGPYMKNFKTAAEKLIENDGAIQLHTPEKLPGKLLELLNGDAIRTQIGETGKHTIEINRGATQNTVQIIKPFCK